MDPRVGAPIDANGNLTSDGTRAFEWDARNQLVAVNVGTHRSEFTYDGSLRRVRVAEKENGAVQSEARVLWCVTELCEERATDGISVSRRVFGRAEQVEATARYFAMDHLRSVRQILDETGIAVTTYDFDAWGRRTLVGGLAITKVGFTSHEWHGTAETWLAPYRVYSSPLGRWLSDDPIRARGTTFNWAQYLQSRPISFIDPLGLSGISAGAGSVSLCEVHRYRNLYNRCPKQKPDDWPTLLVANKHRLPDGSECAFDKCGNLLSDENANYTFNFEADIWSVGHIMFDVLPHFVCGGNYAPNLTTVY